MKKKIIFCALFFIVSVLFFCQGNSQNNWIPQNSGTTNELTSISFINPNTGFMCGYGGTVIKTTNGGANWTTVTIPYNNFYAIYMVTDNIVITGGVLPPIYRSTNAGLNWTAGEQSPAKQINFHNSNTGWISSSNLLKTTNAGQNWSYYNFYNNRNPTGIHFPDSLTGYAFGQNYQAPYYINFIQKTTNGGLIWSEIYTIQNSGSLMFTGIYFINAATGFVGRMGTIWKTTNGGGNWIEYYTPGWKAITDFFFINPSTGWFVADLSYTTNGGVNWTDVSGLNGYLYNVFFINPLTGWVCGENGVIYKTTNGGGILGVSSQGIEIPGKYNLYQNYPNPFNATTSIKYQVASIKDIRLVVFDILGKEVMTLVNEKQKPGTYEVIFDGNNLASGIYFYTIKAGNYIETKRMILIK